MSELFEDDIKGRKAKEDRVKTRGRTRQNVPPRVVELAQTAKGSPEVVLKVSSYAKTRSRAGAHADYIARRGKEGGDLPMETADGSILETAEEVNEVLDDWFARASKRKDTRRTANIVLSSPEGTDPEKVRRAVRDFAGDFFGNRDWMFVVHTDTKNHHAHLSVKTHDFDGNQLRLGKPELKAMRDLYAAKLREQGVEVNSSYRRDRAQWNRGQSTGEYQSRRRLRGTGRESESEAAIRQKGRDKANAPATADPAADAMQASYKRTVAEYQGAARFIREELGGDGSDALAQNLERYAANLKPPETAVDRAAAEHREQLVAQQNRGQDRGRDR